MIKKHLFGCSAVLVFMIIARAFIFNNPVSLSDILVVNKVEPQVEQTPNLDNYINTFSFANEEVPIGDAKIEYRMKKALQSHRYAHLQTDMLHRKAEKWFPLIEPILKVYGIPEDFKYIPLVESGLRAGTSVKGASGFWQFMPGTARSFGLKVNDAVDERQNMRKSTIAACKYIKSMYAELRSWTLVAAAYNVGDVNLRRQINKQNEDNYFRLKLNRETASYVYKLISMKEIIEKPQKYGYGKKPKLVAATVFRPNGKFIDPISNYDGAQSLKALRD
jgi:hypothetical protein